MTGAVVVPRSTLQSEYHLTTAAYPARVRFHKATWIALILITGLGSLTANPLLTPFAIAVLIAVVRLLWRRGEPPVLVFAGAMQWLQAAAAVLYTDFNGLSVAQAGGSPQFETATWLSIAAVLVLAFGMRLALVRSPTSQNAGLITEA